MATWVQEAFTCCPTCSIGIFQPFQPLLSLSHKEVQRSSFWVPMLQRASGVSAALFVPGLNTVRKKWLVLDCLRTGLKMSVNYANSQILELRKHAMHANGTTTVGTGLVGIFDEILAAQAQALGTGPEEAKHRHWGRALRKQWWVSGKGVYKNIMEVTGRDCDRRGCS
eukprot:scaffold148250_cov15-Tisochrysis_lutea.AAC.1